uniref:C2H2-type domain-containing protein n=1 Tax=Panagrellus redivivus TaxID=6233 RepID=A0A7E4W185_PANRE
MQNLSSVFPNLAFPPQKQQQPQTPTPAANGELSNLEGLSLDALFAAGVDLNSYMSMLNASASSKAPVSPTKSTPSTSNAGAPVDFGALLASVLSGEAKDKQTPQQQPIPQKQQQQTSQPSNELELAALLTMLGGGQAAQNAINVATTQAMNQSGFDASMASVLNNFGMPATSSSGTVNGTPSSSNAMGSGYPTPSGNTSTSTSKDAYCEVCDKNFCNRYFLKTHKQKKHGIHSDNSPMETPSKAASRQSKEEKPEEAAPSVEEQPTQSQMPDMDTMLAMLAGINKQNSNSNPELMALMRQFSNSPQHATPVPSSPQKSESAQLMNFGNTTPNHHQKNIMNMIMPGFGGISPFVMPGTEDFGGAFNNLGPMQNLQGLQGSGKPPKRQYSSTTKNYCDLCNKEVCNKYFLRTHMLKMHNIVIDENKTVIANIDTQEKEKEGSVSFRCDLCATNLKTRTELREHKQNAHGIQPLTSVPETPRSSSIPSKAPSTANSASGALSHTAFEFPPAAPSTAAPSETATASSQSTDYKCNRCDADCGTWENLFAHAQSVHATEMTPTELLTYLAGAKPEGEHEADESQAMPVEDEAMQVTEEVALKMVAENLQQFQNNELKAKRVPKFSCDQCKRGYSTQARLDEHISTVHQYKVKMSPKKPNKVVLSPSKINKMIKCFTCMKCHQRFNSSNLCKNHILQHLRSEKRSNSQPKDTDVDMVDVASASGDYKENTERMDFDDGLIESFMREENSHRGGTGGMLEQVVSQLSRRNSQSGSVRKLPEEKHSHTSGSASPMSVNTMPEGFVRPSDASATEEAKPFALQSFVMRELSPEGSHPIFPAELHAFLPVRALQYEGNGPLRVTFELQPAPNMDVSIKNL